MRLRHGWAALGGTTAVCVAWFAALATWMGGPRSAIGPLILTITPVTLALVLAVAQVVLLRPSRRLDFETRPGTRPSFATGPTATMTERATSMADIDDAVAERAGTLANRYLRSHPGVDPDDYVIAATAQHLGAELWTRSLKHFPMFPDLAAPLLRAPVRAGTP